jgi:hypothetical protein
MNPSDTGRVLRHGRIIKPRKSKDKSSPESDPLEPANEAIAKVFFRMNVARSRYDADLPGGSDVVVL